MKEWRRFVLASVVAGGLNVGVINPALAGGCAEGTTQRQEEKDFTIIACADTNAINIYSVNEEGREIGISRVLERCNQTRDRVLYGDYGIDAVVALPTPGTACAFITVQSE